MPTSPSNPTRQLSVSAITAYWEAAKNVCTPNELICLHLRNNRHLGSRRTALALGITRSAVRSRLEQADQKIATALEKENAA